MSATSFLRHRRAAAMAYVTKTLKTHPRRTAEVMAEFKLSPDDLPNLAGNSDVLAIADNLAAEALGEPELDSLETLDTITIGKRAAVHSPDVRKDQFNYLLQHPAAETVGVGNMHDGPQAAEDLANVSGRRVDEHDGSLAAAAREKLADDRLANHGKLPEVVPTSKPAETHQVTAEDERQPTDPQGANPGADTKVDLAAAVTDLTKQEAAAERMEKLGEAALNAMDRQQLLDYAEGQRITLTDIRPRTANTTIVKQILQAQGA